MIVMKRVYQPVGDNIQLDYDPKSGEKVGGIYLPQNAKGAPTILATVVAVGPSCKQVKPGQKAVIAINQMIVLKLDGQEVAFTKEDRVLAVVDVSTTVEPASP
jgi:co-chaperonin GroES (HSP10)